MRSVHEKLIDVLKDQGGAVSILFAAAILAFLGFVALGLDTGMAFVKKNALQNAADAAALAAAKQMPDRAMALETALRVASYNGVIHPENVEVDFPSDDTVAVSVRDRVRFLFAPVLGFREAELLASAKGRFGYTSSISGRPYHEAVTLPDEAPEGAQEDCTRTGNGESDQKDWDEDHSTEKKNENDSSKDKEDKDNSDHSIDHSDKKSKQPENNKNGDHESSDSHDKEKDSERDDQGEDSRDRHDPEEDKADSCGEESRSDSRTEEDSHGDNSSDEHSDRNEKEVERYNGGLAPLAVERDSLIKNSLVALKVEPGFQTKGNFHAVALGQRGASSYERHLKYGYKGSVKIGYLLETQPGDMAGPTRSAIEWRISQDPNATYDSVRHGSPRILYVAVVDSFDEVQGRDSVKVVGFAAFFLEGYSHPGEVIGRFIDTVANGDINGPDFGLKTVRLVR